MHAFFDDSREGHEFTVFAGFLSDDVRWNAFSPEWVTVMHKHGLKGLHTSNFLSGGGEYSGLEMPYEEKLDVLRDLAAVVRKYAVCAFAVGVDNRAYRKALAPVSKKPNADVFCMERLLARVHMKMEELNHIDVLEVAFDDHYDSAPKFYSSWKTVKQRRKIDPMMMTSIAFCDDRFVMPIQAADMLSCGVIREMRLGEDAWGIDSPFRQIIDAPEDPANGPIFVQENWTAEVIERRKDELIKLIQNGQPAY